MGEVTIGSPPPSRKNKRYLGLISALIDVFYWDLRTYMFSDCGPSKMTDNN